MRTLRELADGTRWTRAASVWVLAVAFAVSACTSADADLDTQTAELAVEPIATLQASSDALLARPLSMAVSADGSFVIPDRSDRDIKVYSADGTRVRRVGRPGPGPGEFSAITSGGVFRDSIYGFDVVAERLYVFGPDGRVARSLRVPAGTWSVDAVDDSLFLVTRAVSPARRNSLVLMQPDGTLASSFFDPSGIVAGNPEFVQFASVVADARDGYVFVNVFGTDSLYVFDYRGRQLHKAAVDAASPIADFRRLASANGGRLRRQGGGWVVDEAEVVIALAALPEGKALLHIARYDDRTGVDRVEGGRYVMIAASRRRPPRVIAKTTTAAGLMGRDRQGNPIFLGYTPEDPDSYLVSRMIATRTPR
jgi:hypothetical protein